ncbi:MAG: prolyl oligopeptidase family serine peptidase [Clostridiales bacterium]|jgi:dienelactone hydrolase|nr:prolyl oligopeptidase family serine peptidase [Clostridiales bacterium]
MDYEKFLDRQFVMTDAGRIDRVRDLYTTFNPKVDLEALKSCGYLEALEEMMQPILDWRDDHSPEVIAYWAKLGMVKEFHGEDEPMSWTEYEMKTGYRWEDPERQGIQNRFKKWNSFVPVSAFKPENKDRKYPAVVVLHGGFNPISIIDGWGFPQEAARREWILIVPSIELDDIIDEILEEAKKLYPIDESRIYATGFSYGGFMSNFLGNKRPDVYAAVGPCGAPISNGYVDKAIGPEPQTPFDGIPRAIAMGTYMPIINVAGNLDGFRFPLYDYKDFRTGESGTKQLVDGINSWARVNKAKEISLDEVMALKTREDISDEEKHIGMPLEPDCRRTVVADGIVNYIGDLKSEDGIARVRIMCSMNMPHWPTPEMSRQVFEFFSHFKRDPVTKESIYIP